LRWESPVLGKIPPSEFITIAEETGLIHSIGEWVLRTACRENKRWQEVYGSQTIISVNISLIQLRQKNFIEMVQGILTETGLEARYLELEVTESIFIDSFDAIVEKLQMLRNIGVKVSLDDFGTGFSSLNYLTKLPLDTVKIDKSFVQNIKYGTVEREMIQSIISLAHHLKLEIVAEGVEEKEQLKYLIDGQCDYCQGFLLFMPDCKEKMEEIFQEEI
jgi:EAL domain-containing protein (putative c-di-GMP-specific phosphodiesterase class I)